jgi:hypothetical protein
MKKIMRNHSKRRAARVLGVRHGGEIFLRDGSMTRRDGLRARERTLDLS